MAAAAAVGEAVEVVVAVEAVEVVEVVAAGGAADRRAVEVGVGVDNSCKWDHSRCRRGCRRRRR